MRMKRMVCCQCKSKMSKNFSIYIDEKEDNYMYITCNRCGSVLFEADMEFVFMQTPKTENGNRIFNYIMEEITAERGDLIHHSD